MLSNKRKLFETILLVALFIIGFALGAVLGNSRLNKNKVSDTTALAITFMDSRIKEMETVSNLTKNALNGISELQKFQPLMQTISQEASKSAIYSQTAVGAIARMRKGTNVTNYENHINRVVLSYLMLDVNALSIHDLVNSTDSFLQDKDISQYRDLAFVRDLWVDYFLVESVVKDKKTLISYWANYSYFLQEEGTKACFNILTEDSKLAISKAYCINEDVFALDGRYLKDGSLDAAIAKISSRGNIFAPVETAEFPIIDRAKMASVDSVYLNNEYLTSVAIIVPGASN